MNTQSRKQNALAGDMSARHGPRTTDHGPGPSGLGLQPLAFSLSSLRAFTLIELLIVIAVMAILASLTFPILGAVRKNMIRTRARGELKQLETALDAYRDKFGHYPPDSGAPYQDNRPPQLYYELLGTSRLTNSSGVIYYQTLDGHSLITNVSAAFGANVGGFINCTRDTGGDEAPTGIAIIKDLKPTQWANITNCYVLGAALDGPFTWQDLISSRKINPWHYNSSNPRYNPKSYDLWLDVTVGDKTNRISNWSETPLVVSTPYSG